jgi:hypothetical protein
MNWNRLKKRLMGAALVLALLFSIGGIFNSTAQARSHGLSGNFYDRREDRQKGYRDGLDRGEEDARDRRRFDPNNSEHFRDGNNAYREGFRRGYADGYRRYARRRH